MSQPNVSACFESLSSTVQSAETIQESIGAHYTLKLIQKENKTAFQKIYNLLDNKLLSKIQRSRGKGYAKLRCLRNVWCRGCQCEDK